MLRALAAAILALVLTGCQNMPPPYPLPAQFQPFETFRPYQMSHIVDLAEKGAAVQFVSDILPPLNGWSWTKKRPTVKVKTNRTQNVRYEIEFVLADVTFRATGPVTVTFFVDDHVLGSQRYDKPGGKRWEKMVPAEWLRPNAETLVGAEVDKLFYSPPDKTQLGLILNSIGLTEIRPEQ